MSNASQLSVDVPILVTDRLKLRGHHADDFVHSAAMWADLRVTRHIRDQPFTEGESWTRFLRHIGHWLLLGFGVEDSVSGKFLGELSFAEYKRELEPSLKCIPEAGWAFATEAHGRGLATEALRAAVAWGDGHFGPARTACIIAPEHLASMNVAIKCGYRELQPATYKGYPVTMFVREPQA